MKKIRNVFIDTLKSPYMILCLLLIKFLVYYALIDIKIFESSAVFISIIIMGMLFLGFSRSNIRKKHIWFSICYFLLSLVMFMDSMYFNYYNQTVSVRQIWQASNVAKVPSSFLATLIPVSFVLLIDLPLAYYYFKRDNKLSNGKHTILGRKIPVIQIIIVAAIIIVSVNPFNMKMFSKVNSVEFFTNHINDIIYSVKESVVKTPVSEAEVIKSVDEVVKGSLNNRYYGIAKNKNLIVIQIEAFQNFLINQEYNGQEITPNINKLVGNDSLYFDHYFCNIGKGNTADAEFSTLNSLYPVIDGESYRLFKDNTYRGLPWLLKEEGYSTVAIHGYEGKFWNRKAAYPYQGIDKFYAMEDLNANEVIGLGISDKSMFKQSVDILKEQQKPFFSFIITLTNHHPYILEDKDSTLVLKEEDRDTKFGDYLKTARYTDEAIGEFIQELKDNGLYDDTVIALYGDHHGLNCKMEEVQDQMKEMVGRDYDFDEMFRIPLIIHIPGSNLERTISTVGGQIDFLPTIANLMALKIDTPYVLGQDIVNADEGFVAFTAYMFEGSFAKDGVMFEISREGIFEGSRAWNIDTGEELDASLYEEDYNKAIKSKKSSKAILEQNLILGTTDKGRK